MSASGLAHALGETLGRDRFLNLKHWAVETPAASALAAPGFQPLTYFVLWNHLEATRRVLRKTGLQPGETVALVTRPGPQAFTGFLATAGEFACAPFDPTLTEVEFRAYFLRLGARVLLVEDGAAPQASAAARAVGMGVLPIRTHPQQASGQFVIETAAIPERPGRKIEAGLVLHTSATTGNPKLVPLSHVNLQALAETSSRSSGVTAADRLLSFMPMFHLQGLASSSSQIFAGGMVICTPRFQPENFQMWLDEFQPTWTSLNPAVLRVIFAQAREHPVSARRLPFRMIRTSGAPADNELLDSFEELLGIPTLQSYSMTESPVITRCTVGARKPGSVGRSVGLEIAILNEAGDALPADAEGEIAVRGATLTSGYLDDPEANRAAFRNGWFHTGDIGRLDTDGYLFLTGRKKEMINRGGKKVFPAEVDQALARHAAVHEAAAFAVPHPTLGEDLAAAVVLREGAAVTELELRRFLEAHLAAHKIPRSIMFLDAIPHTASSKVRRSVLTAQYGVAGETRRTAPRETPPGIEALESRLLDIWRRILETSEVDPGDDFFRLGGDSLSAALMLTEVERALLMRRGSLARVDLFDNLTVHSLARALANEDRTPAGNPANSPHSTDILAFQIEGSLAPFFCFAASSLDPYYLRHLARSLGREQPFYVIRPPERMNGERLLKIEDLAVNAISAIRSVRPCGPYVIGGHCYGGVLAFETTRQLLGQGERVGPLVLLDVPAPGYPKVARNWRRYLAESRRVAGSWARLERALQAGELLRHLHRLKRLSVRKLKGQTGRALASLASTRSLAGLAQGELNSLAMAEYVLRDFTGPILHFIAADEAVSTRVLDDPRYGWRDFARGGLDFRSVRGGHNSMLAAENAPRLAAELHQALTTSQRRSTA